MKKIYSGNSFKLWGIPANTTVYFKVTAVKNGVESDYSNVASQRIEDMLADAPWTTRHKISWSPQDILPAGMDILLANAECLKGIAPIREIYYF